MRKDAIYTPIDLHLIKSAYTREYKSFYPSDASCVIEGKVVGSCLRKQYYLWKNVLPTEDKSYKMMLSAALGNACEKFFLDIYRKKGLLKEAGRRIFANVWGLPVSGKLDGETTEGQLIEVKSAYGTAFYNSVNRDPKPEHLCQIMVYFGITGYEECILPYMCRDNTNNRAGYLVTKKEIEGRGIYLARIMQRWKTLKHHLDVAEPPKCDFEAKDWQCGYCIFRKLCHGEAPMIVRRPKKAGEAMEGDRKEATSELKRKNRKTKTKSGTPEAEDLDLFRRPLL